MKDTRRWLKAISESYYYGANAEQKDAKTNMYMNRMYWKRAGVNALSNADEDMCRLLCDEFDKNTKKKKDDTADAPKKPKQPLRAPRREINTFQFPAAGDSPAELAGKRAVWNTSFTYLRTFTTFLNEFYGRSVDGLSADLKLVQTEVKKALERRRLTNSRTGSFRVMFALFEYHAASMALLADDHGGDGGGGGSNTGGAGLGDGGEGEDGGGGGAPDGEGRTTHDGDSSSGHHPDGTGGSGGSGGDDASAGREGDRGAGDGSGGPTGGREGGETDSMDDGDSSDSDDSDDDEDEESVRRDIEDIKAGITQAMAPIKEQIQSSVDKFMKGIYHDLKSSLFGRRNVSPKELKLFRRKLNEK